LQIGLPGIRTSDAIFSCVLSPGRSGGSGPGGIPSLQSRPSSSEPPAVTVNVGLLGDDRLKQDMSGTDEPVHGASARQGLVNASMIRPIFQAEMLDRHGVGWQD
jgi:hypothetical protein